MEWALEDTEGPPPVFFYAGIRTVGPAAAVVAAAPEEIFIDDPVIGDAYVEDPASRARYALEPTAEDMLMMRVTPPARLPLDAFRASLVHFILMHMESESIVVVEPLPLSVDWNRFGATCFIASSFRAPCKSGCNLCCARSSSWLRTTAMCCARLMRRSRCCPLCRRTRVRLVQVVDGGVWRFEDVSECY